MLSTYVLKLLEGVRCYIKIIESIIFFLGVIEVFLSSEFDLLEQSTLLSIS